MARTETAPAITIRSFTHAQYNWVAQESLRTGQTMSSVIKIIVQREMDDKEREKERLKALGNTGDTATN